MSEDGFVDETWTFAGFRTDRAGKSRWWEWYPEGVTGDDKSLLYAVQSGPTPVVGGMYTLPVRREDDNITAKIGRRVYAGPNPDSDLVARVQVLHQTNTTRYRRAGIERSDKRKSGVDEALAPVLELARRLPPGDRDAFAVYVLRKIQGAW